MSFISTYFKYTLLPGTYCMYLIINNFYEPKLHGTYSNSFSVRGAKSSYLLIMESNTDLFFQKQNLN
jgi:hypothetical protein